MKLKKFFAVAMAAVMSISLFACGSDESKKKDTTDKKESSIDISEVKLINNGVLTVACEASYPPFENVAEDGKTIVGYDADIISEVADRLGLDVNIVNTSWDGIFEGIDVNYDCVCSAVTVTPDRQETMLFSTPYITNYQTVVVLKGNKDNIKDFYDLDGKSVAVQKETTSDIVMSDLKSTGTIDVNIVANEKVPSCFTQLENGEIDAVVADSSVADGYVMSNPDKFEIVYQDKEEAEQFAVAMGKENEALRKAINEALADMEEDGFIEETYEYWFGKTE